MSALEKLSQHFADTAAAKDAEEVPAEKAAQIKHLEQFPSSYVTWFRTNGSEYFQHDDVKNMLQDLKTGYNNMAVIYASKQHDSAWQQEQYRNALAGYHSTQAALKELDTSAETVSYFTAPPTEGSEEQ